MDMRRSDSGLYIPSSLGDPKGPGPWGDVIRKVERFWGLPGIQSVAGATYDMDPRPAPDSVKERLGREFRDCSWVLPDAFHGTQALICHPPPPSDRTPWDGMLPGIIPEAPEKELVPCISGGEFCLNDGYLEVGISSRGPFFYIIQVEVINIMHRPLHTPPEGMDGTDVRRKLIDVLFSLGYGMIPDQHLSLPVDFEGDGKKEEGTIFSLLFDPDMKKPFDG